MITPQSIAIQDYDYPLPEARIAKHPLPQRDRSKLLLYRGGTIDESQFYHLPELLPPDSLLVMNDTKVIHARLRFQKPTGSTIEVFCLEPWQMPLSEAFEQTTQCEWLCFVGNNRKWKAEPLCATLRIGNCDVSLTAERRVAVGNAWRVLFRWDAPLSFATLIEEAGSIPLPPYLHREAERDDNERYQTVYATHEGSVAAPTAGLHFTPDVLKALAERNIATEYITLHVGAGTFKPVSSETIGEHEMHVEPIQVSRQNLEHILSHGSKPLIAVGTTSVRTLESVYWFGVQLCDRQQPTSMHIQQWDPYTLPQHVSRDEALRRVLQWMDAHDTDTLQGDTRLLIAPGYTYHVVSGLITNFHQPRSTLLLLVSALIGKSWRDCYRYALSHDFRFLSYGDSCLFLP